MEVSLLSVARFALIVWFPLTLPFVRTGPQPPHGCGPDRFGNPWQSVAPPSIVVLCRAVGCVRFLRTVRRQLWPIELNDLSVSFSPKPRLGRRIRETVSPGS